jgi:hypothetical protein
VHVAYWVIAALLAAVYVFGGAKKLLQSQDQLRPMMGWVDAMPMPLVRTIGLLEVLGAVGVILPPLTGIAPPRRSASRSSRSALSRFTCPATNWRTSR